MKTAAWIPALSVVLGGLRLVAAVRASEEPPPAAVAASNAVIQIVVPSNVVLEIVSLPGGVAGRAIDSEIQP